MNAKPRVIRKALCTWVPRPDYERFRAIAKSNGVTAAEYLRSMIVDVLAEETLKTVDPTRITTMKDDPRFNAFAAIR